MCGNLTTKLPNTKQSKHDHFQPDWKDWPHLKAEQKSAKSKHHQLQGTKNAWFTFSAVYPPSQLFVIYTNIYIYIPSRSFTWNLQMTWICLRWFLLSTVATHVAISNRKYIYIHGEFAIVMLVYRNLCSLWIHPHPSRTSWFSVLSYSKIRYLYPNPFGKETWVEHRAIFDPSLENYEHFATKFKFNTPKICPIGGGLSPSGYI